MMLEFNLIGCRLNYNDAVLRLFIGHDICRRVVKLYLYASENEFPKARGEQ